MRNPQSRSGVVAGIAVLGTALIAGHAWSQEVLNRSLIVRGSQCVGQDCANRENFQADTIRLKEHNLRIHFDDTSNAREFPRNDWRITINDSANGGRSKFSIDDVSHGSTPFTIEAGVRPHALYVEDTGKVGIGTSTPVVRLHLRDGNTPTVRLDQDGSSGWPAQQWDLGGNEENFFVRDQTNGSVLPFRIRPGAPGDSFHIARDGKIGLGTDSPERNLEIWSQAPAVRLHKVAARGLPAQTWDLDTRGGAFSVTNLTANTVPFSIDRSAPFNSIYVETNGNVGLGTPAPAQKLTVVGNALVSHATPGIYITNTGGAANNRTARIRKFGFGNGTRFSIDAVSDDLRGVDTAYTFLRPDGGNVSEHQFFTGGAQNLTIDAAGNVAIRGTTFGDASAGNLHLFNGSAPAGGVVDGVILYSEDGPGGTAQFRVRDEAGNVTTTSPHDFAGYTPAADDPFPWSYHSRNDFLGQEMWVDMSGAIRAVEMLTGETFIHRQTFAKADWAKAKQAAADAVREREILKRMQEEVEVPKSAAIETVEVTETVEGTETETVYRFDPETGAVVAEERPVMVERPTGKQRMRIRAGIRFDERTGKFFRNKTRTEAEAEVPAATAQKMPGWIAARIDAL